MNKNQRDALLSLLAGVFHIAILAAMFFAVYSGKGITIAVSALICGIYVFGSSFLLSKYGLIKSFYSGLLLAAPCLAFSTFGMADLVINSNAPAFIFWFGISCAILLLAASGIFTSRKLANALTH